MKERLDVILVNQGHAQSREKAKAVIMAGNVYVNGQKEDKAGTMFEKIKRWYELGYWTREKVLQAFDNDVITQEEAEEILAIK